MISKAEYQSNQDLWKYLRLKEDTSEKCILRLRYDVLLGSYVTNADQSQMERQYRMLSFPIQTDLFWNNWHDSRKIWPTNLILCLHSIALCSC